MDIGKLEKMKVVELRNELQSRGLDTKGVKAVLIERLRSYLEIKIKDGASPTPADADTTPSIVDTPSRRGRRTRSQSRSPSPQIIKQSEPLSEEIAAETSEDGDPVATEEAADASDEDSIDKAETDTPEQQPDIEVIPSSEEEEGNSVESAAEAKEVIPDVENDDEDAEEDLTHVEEEKILDAEKPESVVGQEEEESMQTDEHEEEANEEKSEENVEKSEEAKIESDVDAGVEERTAKPNEEKTVEQNEEKSEHVRDNSELRRSKKSRSRSRSQSRENRDRSRSAHRSHSESGSTVADKSRDVERENRSSLNHEEIKEVAEDEPHIEDKQFGLSWYDSDLHLSIDPITFNSAKQLPHDVFALVWSGARTNFGVRKGKVCFEVRLSEEIPVGNLHKFRNEPHLRGFRVGFSLAKSACLQLGESEMSFAYCESGRKALNSEFKDYGKPFQLDDVIGCYLDLESSPCNIKYTLNGEDLGVAFEFDRSALGEEDALFPHILCKGYELQVNFADNDNLLANCERPTRRKLRSKPEETKAAEEVKEEEQNDTNGENEEKTQDAEKEQESENAANEEKSETMEVGEAVETKNINKEDDVLEAMETDTAEKSEQHEEKKVENDNDVEKKDGHSKDDKVEDQQAKDEEKEKKVEAQDEEKETVASDAQDDNGPSPNKRPKTEDVPESNNAKSTSVAALEEEYEDVVPEHRDVVDLLPSYELIALIPEEQYIAGPQRPDSRSECEVIILIGLPGSGKTYWTEKYVQEHPEKRYHVIGADALMAKMTIDGESRRKIHKGHWDAVYESCINSLALLEDIAVKRRRNFVLDQTNIYASVQRRKMKGFANFKRIAVVCVPNEEELNRRIAEKTEKGYVYSLREATLNNLRANFSLPSLDFAWFDDVIYTDLKGDEAKAELKKINEKGKKALDASRDNNRNRSRDHQPRDDRRRYDDRRRDFRQDNRWQDRRGPYAASGGGGGGSHHHNNGGSRWGPPNNASSGGGNMMGGYHRPSGGGGGGGWRDQDRGYSNQNMRGGGGSGGGSSNYGGNRPQQRYYNQQPAQNNWMNNNRNRYDDRFNRSGGASRFDSYGGGGGGGNSSGGGRDYRDRERDRNGGGGGPRRDNYRNLGGGSQNQRDFRVGHRDNRVDDSRGGYDRSASISSSNSSKYNNPAHTSATTGYDQYKNGGAQNKGGKWNSFNQYQPYYQQQQQAHGNSWQQPAQEHNQYQQQQQQESAQYWNYGNVQGYGGDQQQQQQQQWNSSNSTQQQQEWMAWWQQQQQQQQQQAQTSASDSTSSTAVAGGAAAAADPNQYWSQYMYNNQTAAGTTTATNTSNQKK